MSILPRCEQCGGEFDPLTGGICASSADGRHSHEFEYMLRKAH